MGREDRPDGGRAGWMRRVGRIRRRKARKEKKMEAAEVAPSVSKRSEERLPREKKPYPKPDLETRKLRFPARLSSEALAQGSPAVPQAREDSHRAEDCPDCSVCVSSPVPPKPPSYRLHPLHQQFSPLLAGRGGGVLFLRRHRFVLLHHHIHHNFIIGWRIVPHALYVLRLCLLLCLPSLPAAGLLHFTKSFLRLLPVPVRYVRKPFRVLVGASLGDSFCKCFFC